MTEITINFTYIFAVMYAVAKAAASVWICKREFLYPIWNSDGIQVQRGLHHKIQSFLRNWAINPEWGLLKAIAFAPVFLATGKRFIHVFMPWRVQKAPPFCQRCKDKGRYRNNSFVVMEDKGKWVDCECRNKITPGLKPDHACHVCLDQKTIGKNRPCPHCERRGIFVRHAQNELNKSQIKNPECCVGCGIETELKELSLIGEDDSTSRWFCHKCLGRAKKNRIVDIDIQPDFVKRRICEHCGFYYRPSGPCEDNLCSQCYLLTMTSKKSQILPDPYSYLKGAPCFCGDPADEVKVEDKSRFHAHSLRHVQLTELQVGDTVVIRACNRGHRNEGRAGQSLRILGLNLPFAVIESDDGGYVEPIDLRGMKIYGLRDEEKTWRRYMGEYQPLLDPTALKVGDTFVVLNICEGKSDGSYRGSAFRVTRGNCGSIIEADLLSFRTLHETSSSFICKGLQILPVNGQYINASRSHFPDIM